VALGGHPATHVRRSEAPRLSTTSVPGGYWTCDPAASRDGPTISRYHAARRRVASGPAGEDVARGDGRGRHGSRTPGCVWWRGHREERPFSIPDWDPLPGAIDLRVIDENGATTVCVELKVTKTDETIWDMLKLLAALRVPGVRSAYVVVASKDDPWGSGREAAELFPSEAGSRLRIRSADLFDRYWRSWTHLLLEGRARPLRAPDEFEIRSVACVPLKLYPGWSIRAVGVQPCGNRWLPFQEGWPLGMTPGC